MAKTEQEIIRQLQEEKQFKETLLSISEAMAVIQGRKALLKTIFESIKPVFGFYDVGIFIIDEEKDVAIDLAVLHPDIDNSEINYLHYDNHLGETPFRNMAVEWMVKQIEQEDSPVLLDFRDIIAKNPEDPNIINIVQIQERLSIEYRDCLAYTLNASGERLGMLCLKALEKDFFHPAQFRLFQAIAEQISIAVANILANEAIRQRNLEKSVQIALIDSLNKEMNWESRQKKFAHALSQIFPADFIGFHYAKEGMYEVSFGFEKTGADEYRKVTLMDFLDKTNLNLKVFEEVLKEEEDQLPFILEIEENAEAGQYLNPIREKSLKLLGLKSVLAVCMQVDNAPFYIYINSKNSNSYHQEHIEIFERIAPSFSQSLEKSLVSEQVLAEKQFKETLLEITESIANINTGKDLVKAMFDKLQKVFPFDEVGLFVFDWEKELERDLMVDYEYGATTWNQRMNQAGPSGWQPLTEISKYLVDQGLSIMDTATFFRKFEHPHMKFIQEKTFRQVIFGPLRQGEATVGGLYFWSENKARFKEADRTIFQSIASQLSVALVNVLANEQIQQENKEKQLLLEVSRAIGSARSIVALMENVLQTVAPIFQSQEYSLIIIDEENDEYKDLAVLYHEDYPSSETDRRYYQMGFYTTEKVPYEGSQIQAVVQNFEKNEGDPIYFDLNKNYSGYTDQNLFEQVKQDASEAVFAPLKVAGKTFGVFVLAFTGENRFNREQLSLFRSVSNQLATAVSNALADEDIYRREKEKVLQVDLVNTLNQDASWSERLEKASALLNDHMQGDLVIFAIQPEGYSEYCHTFEHIGPDEYRHFNYHSLLDFVGVKEKEYQQTREMSMETILVSGNILEKYAKKDRLLAGIVKRFSIKSWLSIALQLGLPGRYRVSLLSKKNNAYSQQDKDFLLRLRPVMQITIEKLLAYERIVHLSNQLQQEKDYLQEEVNTTFDFANMVGQTQSMRAVFQRVRQVAKSDTTVLVLGETGTGKELIARALHDASPRKDKPLVKLNCAALPESLIESELFGHEKGAFTGALKKRVGKFELAHKGTIFLDEIGELPLTIQAKLLRVIQEKEFEPLGSNKTIKSDFRLIVATNRNLLEEIQKGNFRPDLYYRLNVFPVLLPPLHQRVEDIPLLINHYGNFYAKKLGYQYNGISSSSLEKLLAYHWPGNIRELQNMIEQGILVQGNKKLLLSPQTDQFANSPGVTRTSLANIEISEEELENITLKDIDQKKSQVEKAYLEAVMQKTRWRISGRHGAAALLDVKASTLESRLKKLGLGRG